MTIEDKQKIADFIGITSDFFFSGYISNHEEYNFTDDSEDALDTQHESVSQNGEITEENDSLEKIAGEIKACMNCPLAATRKNTVPGEGVLHPLVLVIGEGPGADEDTQGRPFVGRAGQLLDKILASIQLSRKSNCFIANVVKCRPPNNRDPHPEERKACAHFLRRQIAFLKPKFILLTGNVAAQSLLQIKEQVGKIHGRFFDFNIDNLTIPLMVTYHPSALLYSDEYKRPVWEDLKLLRARIENNEQ